MSRKWQNILALMMASTLVFGGCGNNTGSGSEDPSDTENPGQEQSESDTDQTGEEAVKHIPLMLYTEEKNDYSYTNSYVNVNYVHAELREEEDEAAYPKLAQALEDYSSDKENDFENMLQQLTKAAQDFDANYDSTDSEGEDAGVTAGMTDEHTAYVMRSDSAAVSILDYDYYYEYPGSHPFYSYSALNLDSKTGTEIMLSDIVTDQDAFLELLKTKLQAQYGDLYDSFDTETVFGNMQTDLDQNTVWTIDEEGITVYFNVYELSSYAAGAQIVSVSFAEAKDILGEEYSAVPDSYIIPWLEMTTRNIDVDGDGNTESVSVNDTDSQLMDTDSGEYYESYYQTSIMIDDAEYSLDQESMNGDRYLVYANGQYYMYIFQDFDSTWPNLVVYDLKNLTEKSMDIGAGVYARNIYSDDTDANTSELTEIRYAFTDPENMVMGSGTYLLGTIDGYRTYTAGDDGLPQPKEPYYLMESDFVIHALSDITCDIVDETGEVTDAGNGTIPSGSYLRYVRTDNETYVDLQIIDASEVEENETNSSDWHYYHMKEYEEVDDDAKIYRIYPTRSEDAYENLINDRPESEMLEGIVYVG